jgi:hypothetical protein
LENSSDWDSEPVTRIDFSRLRERLSCKFGHLEDDYTSTARPSGFKTTMRIRRILWAVASSNTKRDSPALGMSSELIQQICPVIVVSHHSFVEHNPALASPVPATHRREAAAISDTTYREFILHSAVSKTVYTVGSYFPDSWCDVIPAWNNNICTQTPN